MSTVWKIGSRWSEWGDPKTKIFSIFEQYNIAFAYTNAVLDVHPRDLIAVADGVDIIAIGEVLSPPCKMLEMNIAFSEEHRGYFDENVCGFFVHYHWLSEDQRFEYKKRCRFCHATSIEEKVNKMYDEMKALEGREK